MQTTIATLRRTAGLICAGALLAVPAVRVLANDAPNADAFPDFESYIKIAGQAPFINGDGAAFATRTGNPTSGTAGIEDLFYTKDLNDTTTLTINGRALAGTDDYLASFKVDKDKVGSIDAGYSRFRTFYDGVGGFFPLSDTMYKWAPETLHVDRSKLWIDLKLAMPNKPVFTISYHNEQRTGMKDSTEWAPVISPLAVVTAGKLVGTVAPVNTPYVNPNVQTLDEHHQIFSAGMEANIGNTTENLKIAVDKVNNDDGRSYVKYPNSNVIADPQVVVTDDEEKRVSNSFRVTNLTDTKFNDAWALATGLTYMHETSTDGGTWLTPTYAATPNAVYLAETAANIYGSSTVEDFTGNISLDYTPTKDWLLKMGYRQEEEVIYSNGGFENTTLLSTAKTVAPANITTREELTYSNYLNKAETPEVELQYSGIKDMVFYAEGNLRVDHDNQHWINPYVAVSTTGLGVVTNTGASPGSVFFQEADQNNDYAKVGANWNPVSYFSFRAEIFRKDDQNQFVGQNSFIGTASYGALYATGYTLTGAKLTIILKPTPTVTITSRYQPQHGNMSVLANSVTGGNGYNEVTSGTVKGQMFSEAVSWSPNKSVFLQGDVNVVYNTIQTAYPTVVVSTTTNVPTPFDNSINDYITGDVVCGFAVDKATDASIKLTYAHAGDTNQEVAYGGQPYGAGFEDKSATLGLKHKFSDRLVAEGRAGYLRRVDQTTGGFTNYKGPLFYVSLTYGL